MRYQQKKRGGSLTLIILITIFLLNPVTCDVVQNILPKSHVRTVRVKTEFRDSNSNGNVYDVAIISTEFKNGFEISTHKDKRTDGVTRLRCGTTLYESHNFMDNQEGRVYSYESASEHPAILLALLQCTRSRTCSSSYNDRVLYNFIILKQREFNSYIQMSDSIWNIQVENITNCELIVLIPEEQTIIPPRVIRDKKTKNIMYGVSHLISDDSMSCTDNKHSNETMMRSVVLPNLAQHLDNLLHERASSGACIDVTFSSSSTTTTISSSSSPPPPPPTTTTTTTNNDDVKFFNDQFLETSTGIQTKFSFIMDPLMKVLPIDLLTDIVGSLVATGIIGNDLEHTTAETASALLEMEITNVLVSGLTHRVRTSLIDTLTETISESASESIALDMKRQVSSTLTSSMSTEMTRQIDRDVAEYLPSRVNAFAPARLARKLVSSLGLVLTKSLSHTIVPSLIQTTGHSPLQDYYCYYCYHFQRYCQYCHYAPSQLYYAEYYTTYYSNYYATYYSDFFQRESDIAWANSS